MTKHFEELWEEGEQLGLTPLSVLELNQKIFALYQDSFSSAEKVFHLGAILLSLCAISRKYNINVYAALQQAITESKIDLLE